MDKIRNLTITMTQYSQILEYYIGKVSVRQILIDLAIFFGFQIASFVFIKTLKFILLKIPSNLVTTIIETGSGHLNILFYQTIGVLAVSKISTLPEIVSFWLDKIVILSLSFFTIVILQDILQYGIIQTLKRNHTDSKRDFDPAQGHFLYSVLRVILWIIVLAIILPYIQPGANLAGIVATLGVTGIAVAFAMQNVLTDIIASFILFLDKPFEVGDFIETNSDSGTVLKVGLRSTRLRSLLGEEIVIPNRDLTTVRIHNFKLLERRRVRFEFGVEYFNQASTHEKATKKVKEIIKAKKLATLDRVVIKELAEAHIKYEVVYYVESNKYDDFANIQHEIFVEILKSFEQLGVKFTAAVAPVI